MLDYILKTYHLYNCIFAEYITKYKKKPNVQNV